jgi:beta-galactosidase
MTKRFLIILTASLFFACSSNKSGIKQGVEWRDTNGKIINAHGGGILFYNGVYYWYGEYKGDSTYRLERVKTWECWRADAGGVSCYSSKNLSNWKFEGIVLPVTLGDTTSDLHPSQVIERPKVIYNEKTKKFVMWMHIESPDYEKAHAGIAVSDSPTSVFTYQGSFKPNGADSRDQTIFKDDDGKAYQIASSEWNKTLYINQLNESYTNTSGVFKRIFIDQSREAPAIFKHNQKYYLITSGCTGWDANTAEYAVADSIMGHWTVMGNPCTGPNAEYTFSAQSTFVFPVEGKSDLYIAMFDQWNKTDLDNSRYIWLPVIFHDEKIEIPWQQEWQIKMNN